MAFFTQMSLDSKAFLSSPYNFFDHRNPCLIYNESAMLSGLAIRNGLGLENPLTLIYKDNGCPALDSNDENIFWFPTPITNLVNDRAALSTEAGNRISILNDIYNTAQSIIDIEAEILIDEAINLVHPFRWYAFGHLHDSLTKLYNLRSLNYCRENVRYIIADPYRIKNFEDHLSALAGHKIEKSQIINIGKKRKVLINRLLHPLPPAVPTTHTKDSYEWLINAYFQYYNINTLHDKYRLYLSRNGVRSDSRQVVNEEEVLGFLKPKGFIVVTGDEDLGEIIRLFSSAEIVVGPHGSLFANTIYCQETCRVVEFCPSNRIDKSIQLKHKRAKFYEQYLEDADENFNINIQVERLRSLLE
jgi:hypothetical protein